MKFVLRLSVLDPAPVIEIGLVTFMTLKKSREVLLNAFSIEEKYEILISNYLELEQELLGVAAMISVKALHQYEESFELKVRLNTRLVNLLTAARLYLDHLPQHLGSDNDPVREELKRETHHHYDDCFEYRFMEALRNHVQHRGIPIHLISYGGSWQGDGEERRCEYKTYIASRRDLLEEAGGFKRAVLDQIHEEVDLLMATRRYVERLSAIHAFARQSIDAAVDGARRVVESAHVTYKRSYDGRTPSLCARQIDDSNDAVLETVPLLLEWDDVRVALRARNRQLINLSKRFVTSRS